MSEIPLPVSANFFRRIRNSVRKKMMLVVLTTTLVALLTMGVTMLIYDLRTYRQGWINDMFAQADLIGRASSAALIFDDVKVAQENLALLKVRPRISAAAIYTVKGALFATYVRSDLADQQFPALPEAEGFRVEGNQLVLFKRVEGDNEILGTIYLKGTDELVERLKSYLIILGAVIATSLLVAVIMTAWLQTAMTAPILSVTEVARQVMASRDFSLRARKTSDDEIGYLVDTFNNMLAELGRRALALEESNRSLEHEMEVRRGAEEALRAADRRKDEFLATLAHELRNPLAPMRNALEILRTVGNDAARTRSAREMMERQLRQLVHLVNDLLDISRITTGKMGLKKERSALSAIIQSAVETAAPLLEAREHRFTVKLPSVPVYLWADATRLAQVFLNLLNNAAKFTDPGGRIGLVAEPEGAEIVVTVSDNGIGIPAAMLPMIFDMFAQVDRTLERAHAGLGVGLTLARHLTELHDGTITVYSERLGRGSRFVVRLPVLEEPVRHEQVDDLDVVQMGTAKHRILLADDNVDFVTSLAMILQAMGHEVRVTHDGLEALAAVKDFTPDFIFLDIGLPKLNGYDLARRLRELPATRGSVMVAVTGWGQEEDKRRAREAGFDHHMVKPVEPADIQSILTNFHAKRSE